MNSDKFYMLISPARFMEDQFLQYRRRYRFFTVQNLFRRNIVNVINTRLTFIKTSVK